MPFEVVNVWPVCATPVIVGAVEIAGGVGTPDSDHFAAKYDSRLTRSPLLNSLVTIISFISPVNWVTRSARVAI